MSIVWESVELFFSTLRHVPSIGWLACPNRKIVSRRTNQNFWRCACIPAPPPPAPLDDVFLSQAEKGKRFCVFLVGLKASNFCSHLWASKYSAKLQNRETR